MLKRLIVCAAILLSVQPGAADAPVLREDPRDVAVQLAGLLESKYVFADVGARYAAMLRAKAEAGAYDGLTGSVELGDRLTKDIQAVSPDGHLKVRVRDGEGPRAKVVHPPAIANAEWLKPGVAYLNFRVFRPEQDDVAQINAFMASHTDAKALILDLRQCRGGTLHVPDRILSRVYAKPMALLVMDVRRAIDDEAGGTMKGGDNMPVTHKDAAVVRRTHQVTPSATVGNWPKAPIFVLTSQRTFSACEHVVFALKRTHRATLIGEMTGGGGHFGGRELLGAHLSVFVPVGRTYDPDTGKDWDGVGIEPDISVPADRALEEALGRLS